jgi:hypothetical protein
VVRGRPAGVAKHHPRLLHDIAPGAIDFGKVPDAAKKGLGRYEAPVFRLGRLVAIDAKDDRAAQWYEGFGALRLLDDPLKLILPLA